MFREIRGTTDFECPLFFTVTGAKPGGYVLYGVGKISAVLCGYESQNL